MMEIKEKLRGVLKESIEFNAVRASSRAAPDPSTVVPAPGAIIGRDEDRDKIIAHISARCGTGEGRPVILLICGEGGVGKTTVAQMVFHDTQFRSYRRVWVSSFRYLDEIGKSVISQVSGKEEMSHASDDDLDDITDRLHEVLNGTKVLIVLDDPYMYYYEWESLKRMFSVGDKGTQVIVIGTTEQEKEDPMTQSYSLKPLKPDMCCTIVKQLAARRSVDRSTREDFYRIAELCKGFPLAAQLLGRLLQFRQYEEWTALLDESLWSRDNPVDLAVELSYRSMPPNLRLCLAYCTVSCFAPYLVKEDVIHQWVALGLIEPSDGTISAIKLVEEYIARLLDMSFLQTSILPQDSAKDDTGATLFKMHDSIRSFGYKAIEAEVCVLTTIDGESDAWPSKTLLPEKKIFAINCFLCSKMEISDDSFSVPSCLRVLNLENTPIQKLPYSICHLEQLGYLNLSGCSRLVDLPEKIGNLINLLHINLSGCSELVKLPDSFSMLKILRHINLSGCSRLGTLPESLVKLINLVHMDLSGCCALINLPELFGKLANLMHLNLSGCSGLVTLPGSFGKLTNLVHIDLSSCSGLRNLPQSFGKLTSLVHINLSGCSGLVILPRSIGDLRNLLHIDLSRCYGLSKLPKSFGKLQKLEKIDLSGCSGLETLPGSFGGLKHLLHINLSHCSGLSKLPESFKNLKKLVYLDLSFWSCFEGIQIALGGLTSLQHLNLSHPCCYRADHIHIEGLKEVFHKLSRLQYLNLSMLMNPISYNQSEKKICEYIECISGLYSLEHLDLSHNIFLHDLSRSLSDLYRLHTLDLSGCIRLKKLGQWMTEMDSLKSIILRDCEGLECYEFAVGVNNNINNYAQLEVVTSKVLEIRCLEKMKCLEEAQRIRLIEKRKLQKLKLCWTMDSEHYNSSKQDKSESELSVEDNKPQRSAEDNISERSIEGNEDGDFVPKNKADKSMEENEPEGSMQEIKPKDYVQESETKENNPDRSEEENICDKSIEENAHEGSIEDNKLEDPIQGKKPNSSLGEMNEPEGSMQENKPEGFVQEDKPNKSDDKDDISNRFLEDIEPESSVHENKPSTCEKEENKNGKSAEVNEPEGSVLENKPNMPEDESMEDIEPDGSAQSNKPDGSKEPVEEIESVSFGRNYNQHKSCLMEEDKPGIVVEENLLLGELVPPRNLLCLELNGYSGETCIPSWWTKERCSANLLNLVEVTMEDFPSCRTLPPFSLLPNLQRLVLRRLASITRINATDLSGSSRTEISPLKCTIDDLPSLKEFNTKNNRGDNNSAIEQLVVHRCPHLRFGTLPPRARRLVISECDEAMTSLGKRHEEGFEEEGPSGTSARVITELVVKCCSKPLRQWSLLEHLPILPSLTIKNCSFRALCSSDYDDSNVPQQLGHLSSLQELKIVSCEDDRYMWWVIKNLTLLKALHFKYLERVFRKTWEIMSPLLKSSPSKNAMILIPYRIA